MAASGLISPLTQVVTNTVAATGFTPAFQLKFAEGYYAELVVTASAGTVDVALQHSTDLGATWRTLPLKFAQIATTGTTALVFKPVIGITDAAFAPTPALTGAAQAFNFPFNLKNVRFAVTLGTAGTTTFSVYFTMTPKGNVCQ